MLTLPTEYAMMEEDSLIEKILKIKKQMGSELTILAHHYQNPEIVKLADFAGDSFELAKRGSQLKETKIIVFCGVYFMAEAARTLAGEKQTVYIPNREAGCPLADFAPIKDVVCAWKELEQITDTKKIIPICYMNSSADIKAFCGEHGGLVCTSSNAQKVFQWAFEQGEKIFFFPDENLGRNTADKMKLKDLIVWNPAQILGGNSAEQITKAPVILWKGYCHVHAHWFKTADIDKMRAEHSGVKIIVHPECTPDVVKSADDNGSTAYIIQYVEKAAPECIIAIGTELNLVKRLHDRYKGQKTVIPLKRSVCPNMMKISIPHLLFCLENLDKPDFVVNVEQRVIDNGRLALERMLQVNG